MDDGAARRFPLWLRHPVTIVKIVGAYLAIFTELKLLGVILLAGGMVLFYYVALATKPKKSDEVLPPPTP